MALTLNIDPETKFSDKESLAVTRFMDALIAHYPIAAEHHYIYPFQDYIVVQVPHAGTDDAYMDLIEWAGPVDIEILLDTGVLIVMTQSYKPQS